MTSRHHAQVVAPPPLFFAGTFLVALGLDRLWPWPMPRPEAVRVASPALFGLAIGIGGWAVLTLWRAHTAILPHHATTRLRIDGPFSVSRNPIYLSLLLLYLGFAAWLGSWWPLALAPLMLWGLQQGVISREERYLAELFGDEYAAYRSRVHRWVGRRQG